MKKKGPVSAAEKKKINIIEKDILQLKRFSIKKIHISNFKSVEDLVLTIPPVKPPVEGKEMQESWLLLLGDNGIGKSTILQALALALAGKKQLDKLDLDVTDFLRRGKLKGFVKIESYEHDNVIELNFNKKGFTTKLTEAPTFIMGYGSTRLLPKNNVQPDKDKEPFLNIRNLFDYSVSLIDPEKWLSSVDKKEFDDRVAPAFFDVLALKGDDKVSLIDGKIVIKQYGNDSELEDNSDGYKTVVALVADMMHSLSTDSANYHNSYGIVLLDEIGNHLHPRWRMKIVSALRRAFPRLQFIVTTHEPLCVRGLAHGEVVVMVRDEKQNIRSLDSSVLPDHSLMRVEQLLTSDLFGLINVLDEETEKSYEEYFKLLSKKEENKTEEDKASLKNLSEQLNKTPLGDTIPQQIYYEAINQRYVKKLNEEGFKAKETVKQETLDEVMALIKDQKLSWTIKITRPPAPDFLTDPNGLWVKEIERAKNHYKIKKVELLNLNCLIIRGLKMH